MDAHIIEKPIFVGKTRSCKFQVWLRPFNQFGDIVISFRSQAGFMNHPVNNRPKVYKADQHAKAANDAKALIKAL